MKKKIFISIKKEKLKGYKKEILLFKNNVILLEINLFKNKIKMLIMKIYLKPKKNLF
jgi:hypothetical protein